MIYYIKATKADLTEVSDFIARLNAIDKHHIGYCGLSRQEIADTLLNELTDVSFEESFMLVRKEEALIGVLGFDADIERKSVEIWGPFLIDTNWLLVNELWKEMLILLPVGIKTIGMFIHEKNTNCLSLVHELGFNKISDEVILTIKKSVSNQLQNGSLLELSSEYIREFKMLHDTNFPHTYYSGEDIIKRLSNHQKVFIQIEHNQLVGYIYVEADVSNGDGSIEFFAVDKKHRGRGIGEAVLTMALKWLFTLDNIHEITLCVNASNTKAIKLYERVHFTPKNQLSYFRKQVLDESDVSDVSDLSHS